MEIETLTQMFFEIHIESWVDVKTIRSFQLLEISKPVKEEQRGIYLFFFIWKNPNSIPNYWCLAIVFILSELV